MPDTQTNPSSHPVPPTPTAPEEKDLPPITLGDAIDRLQHIVGADVLLLHFALPPDIARQQRNRLLQCLTPGERDRAAAMAHAPRRVSYLLCRALLRRLLAPCANTSPEALQFNLGPQGKPMLDPAGCGQSAPHFNYSHTGAHLVLAFTRLGSIGVDAEAAIPPQHRTNPTRLAKMVRRFFHPDEAAWLERRPPEHLPVLFTRFWTCKEAVVKGRGDGIQSGLHRFFIDPAPALAGQMVHLPPGVVHPQPWTLQNQCLKGGLTATAAVCSEKKLQFNLFTISEI